MKTHLEFTSPSTAARHILALATLFALAGCSSSAGLTKSQAAARAGVGADGEDVCDVYGWYGDGECDAFCPEADSDDCASCEAIPICGSDETQVDACPPESICHEVSICGTTIVCEQPTFMCDAVPSCAPGETEVTACDGEEPTCHAVSVCGRTTYCEGGIRCEAFPSCGSDEEVPDCEGRVPCYESSICGSTIYCAPPTQTCHAFPACGEMQREVDSCDGEEDCGPVSICGHVIYCAEFLCEAYPECAPGQVEVTAAECAADPDCTEATVCSATIYCTNPS